MFKEEAFSINPSTTEPFNDDGDEEDGEEGRENNKGDKGGESRLEWSRQTKSSFAMRRDPGGGEFPKQGEEGRWRAYFSISVIWVMSAD